MEPLVYVLGHSFVKRFGLRAQRRHQTVAQAVGLDGQYEVRLDGQSGATFARILDGYKRVLGRLRELPQLPVLLIVDLGTNDLCSGDIVIGEVVDRALTLLDALRREHLLPRQVVFLPVLKRARAGCSRGVSKRAFNRRAKAFNALLDARTKSVLGVQVFTKARVNLPKFLSRDGCHLNEQGEVRYGQGLKRAILQYAKRPVGGG